MNTTLLGQIDSLRERARYHHAWMHVAWLDGLASALAEGDLSGIGTARRMLRASERQHREAGRPGFARLTAAVADLYEVAS